jgi:hypothetical protein
MKITGNEKFMFTTQKNGNLFQLDLSKNMDIVRNHGRIFSNGIEALEISSNNKLLWVTGDQGCVKQISIETGQFSKD